MALPQEGQAACISHPPQPHAVKALYQIFRSKNTRAPFPHPAPTHEIEVLFQTWQAKNWDTPLPVHQLAFRADILHQEKQADKTRGYNLSQVTVFRRGVSLQEKVGHHQH